MQANSSAAPTHARAVLKVLGPLEAHVSAHQPGRAPRGLTTVLSNVSALSREFEEVTVWTAHLSDGNLLFGVGVAPLPESATYRNAFNRVLESIQIVG